MLWLLHGVSKQGNVPEQFFFTGLGYCTASVFARDWYTYDVSSSGAIVASGNYTTTALGTTNPTRITLTDNSSKTYTVVVKATNVGGAVASATSGSVSTINPTSISATGATKSTTGLGTTIYMFTTATSTVGIPTGTLIISGGNSLSVNVLAIAGGGAGAGNNAGGGGGAGGLVSTIYTITGTTTLTISLGAGGTGVSTANGNKGIYTTVTFSNPPGGIGNIICNGGGCGLATTDIQGNSNGGSGGGGCSARTAGGTALNTNNNLGNNGGLNDSGYVMGAGGGGAGGIGGNAVRGVSNGAGGVGYQSNITGTNLYWGGRRRGRRVVR